MKFEDILEKINSYVWGSGLIFLLLATGAVYTLKLGFIQLRCLPFLAKSIKNPDIHSQSSGGLSQLKTVCMSLGTAMGTGNITGVASALSIGGAGAVFWMWVSAFFGMALVYAENYLSVTFSEKSTESSLRGPMAYLKNGLGSKRLAAVFAVFCMLAAFGMGGMVQVSSFAESLTECVNISPVLLAVIIFTIIFIVIIGGTGRIGSAAQTLLPIVTVLYTIASIAVLIRFSGNIIPSLRAVFTEAFSFRSAAGGAAGFAVSRAVSAGIRRGIFSNEAGLGSSPILHSAAESSSPSLQGMWSMFEVFFDTIICCTMTALVLLSSSGDNFSVSIAFSSVFGEYTDIFLALSMAVFAFCTIIGWYFCGETAFTYLFGTKHKKSCALIFAFTSSLGAVLTLNTVWTLSDIFNGLMAFPNIIGLLLLINKVKKE